jgi:hypothetical protein
MHKTILEPKRSNPIKTLEMGGLFSSEDGPSDEERYEDDEVLLHTHTLFVHLPRRERCESVL